MRLPDEVSQLPFEADTIRGLRSLLSTLQEAEVRFLQVRQRARLRRLYEVTLHPVGLFLGFVAVSVLTLILLFGSWRWTHRLPSLSALQWSLFVSALAYYAPLVWWTMRREGGEEWEPLLWEIHRADEIVLEQQWKSLLQWPAGHPESMLEEGVPLPRISVAIEERKAQVEAELSRIREGIAAQERESKALARLSQDEAGT